MCAKIDSFKRYIFEHFWGYVIRSTAIWEELVKGLCTLPMLYAITANYKTLASPVGQL